ncbi:uncharacterized protein LOC143540492 [Bidens hawaiensis]|uniref:uncharacterized protein LOC143540492 n=1 Tax=Bidens hawaiensis TaxID=980011 RepID=UPI00404A34D0
MVMQSVIAGTMKNRQQTLPKKMKTVKKRKGCKKGFTHLHESFKMVVRLGDKKELIVQGEGAIKIITQNGNSRLLDDVYYARVLGYNLLSVGQLMKKGYSLLFDDDQCVIKSKTSGQVLMVVPIQTNNMFLLDASKLSSSNDNITPDCAIDDVCTMAQECQGCIVGKKAKESFPYKSWRATKRLELIHTDLCGFMQVSSLGGYSSQSKGYRLYNPLTKKFLTRRDVNSLKIRSGNPTQHPQAYIDPFPISPSNESETDNQPNSPTYSSSTQTPNQNDSPSQNSQQTSAQTHSPNIPTVSSTNQSNPSTSPLQPKTLHIQDVIADTRKIDVDADFYNCQFALNVTDPTNYDEAADKKEWLEAMTTELDAIKRDMTWELVKLPQGKNLVGLKWLFKTKVGLDGNILKHKARLVAKGYSQQDGIDYQETFAPVARFETIRVVLSVAAQMGWLVHQLNVKSRFLNGNLTEEICVEQPHGYVVTGK